MREARNSGRRGGRAIGVATLRAVQAMQKQCNVRLGAALKGLPEHNGARPRAGGEQLGCACKSAALGHKHHRVCGQRAAALHLQVHVHERQQ
jgi:hypothetical protein